jgi:accessory colonization factor AcfC
MKQQCRYHVWFTAIAAAVLVAGPVHGQNARWPPAGGAAAQVLQVYGSGTVAPAMREAATAFGMERGVIINLSSGPIGTWKTKAIRDGDMIFADSQLMMNSFVQRDLASIIDPATICTLTQHPSSIMVRKGNPKKIQGMKDLGRPGLRLLIVVGPDASRWEDAARSAGGDELVEALRRNVAFFPATSAEAQALWESDAGYDAWLVLRPGQKESPKVISRQEDTVYPACVMVLTYRTAQRDLAREFVDFILSARGEEIFSTWGGQSR